MVASIHFIERTIAIFGQATEANRNTPGREGNVVVLTPELADDVMITGDLHGHRRNFNLIRRIAALDEHPRRHLLLQEVCHGGPAYPAKRRLHVARHARRRGRAEGRSIPIGSTSSSATTNWPS